MSLFEFERSGDADALIEALESSANPEVRRRAAELLGSLDDHEDRDAIVGALIDAAEDGDGAVVSAAVDSLDQLGPDAVEALIAGRSAVDLAGEVTDERRSTAFTEALSADVPELRMAAANALGALGRPETVPDLVERFDDPDPRVRGRAARACGAIDDARAVEGLSALLGDPKASVRREAAEALGRIGTRRALESLLALYDDPDKRVRRIAVAGFGAFENDRPVPHLVDAYGDEAPDVRRAAAYATLELLANVPPERGHGIRETVVDHLAGEADETVVDPLVGVLAESSQAAQRRNAAWLLGRVVGEAPDPAVTEALVDALGDEDELTRQFATTSLATIGGEAVEAALLAVLEDEAAAPDVRAQAIFALGKVGGPAARRRLEALLEDAEDETVRKKALAALSKLGGHT